MAKRVVALGGPAVTLTIMLGVAVITRERAAEGPNADRSGKCGKAQPPGNVEGVNILPRQGDDFSVAEAVRDRAIANRGLHTIAHDAHGHATADPRKTDAKTAGQGKHVEGVGCAHNDRTA